MKDVQKMTNEELVNELNNTRQSLEFGVSKRDLLWEEMLWKEVEERGLDVSIKVGVVQLAEDEDVAQLNVVSCGCCGQVFAHELVDLKELTCPYCKMTDDISSFPDLYYPPKHSNSIVSISK